MLLYTGYHLFFGIYFLGRVCLSSEGQCSVSNLPCLQGGDEIMAMRGRPRVGERGT